MIEMTLNEWGKHIFEGTFKVLTINYDAGETIVYDKLREVTYNVTYNIKTGKMELEEVN